MRTPNWRRVAWLAGSKKILISWMSVMPASASATWMVPAQTSKVTSVEVPASGPVATILPPSMRASPSTILRVEGSTCCSTPSFVNPLVTN
jgi:hypothetical protein